MSILDSHEMESSMFANSTKADSDIELWHKRIGHINLNKPKAMQSKGVVIRLPNFIEKERVKHVNLANNVDNHSQRRRT